jgi:hypothetical protein
VAGIKIQLQPTFLIPQNIPMGWLCFFYINFRLAVLAKIAKKQHANK